MTNTIPPCELLPVLKCLSLKEIYPPDDPTQSKVDVAAEYYNAVQAQQITNLMVLCEKAIDTSGAKIGDLAVDCAHQNFLNWAANQGLLTDAMPYSSASVWKRAEYTFGLLALAIKFKSLGYDVSPTLPWLRALLYKVLPEYQPEKQQCNKRVWTGAMAALYCLLDPTDTTAAAFHGSAWQGTIDAIRPGGSIATEMARGARALVYHLYSYSATRVLQAARRAIGTIAAETDVSAIMRLRMFCDCFVNRIEVMADFTSAEQESLATWSFPVMIGFDGRYTSSDWQIPAYTHANAYDATMGGDMSKLASILAEWKK